MLFLLQKPFFIERLLCFIRVNISISFIAAESLMLSVALCLVEEDLKGVYYSCMRGQDLEYGRNKQIFRRCLNQVFSGLISFE